MAEDINTSAIILNNFTEVEEDSRETMVKVDHVTMSFNMASEQLNSLKEYAIKILKRDLFFKEFKALDDVSFEVKKGDVFGIIGTNGSGKSTVLKVIAGVLDPSSGSCLVNGNIAPLIELGAGFDLDLSARENIYLNGALLGYSKEFIDQNFDAIVDFADVRDFLDMPMKNYSSGMVARIAFAIATIIVPDILIVDEVLSVGDFMFQKKCEDRINELIEQYGVTVLIVSHSNDQIARLCNKAVWIEKGHVRLIGEASRVCQVYGALGGRTGDSEAEHEVLETLMNSRGTAVPEGLCMTVTGENANAICSKMVFATQQGLDLKPSRAVALCCDSTHCNSVIATAFAAAYDAPVLSVGRRAIPESVESYLATTKPEHIFVFDCGKCMGESLMRLQALPWNPEIVFFGNDPDPLPYSLEVYQYGLDRNLWSNKVAVIGFWDNPESMAFLPYLYANQCPVLMLSDRVISVENFNLLKKALEGREALVVGPHTNTAFDGLEQETKKAPHKLVRIANEETTDRLAEISQLVYENSISQEASQSEGIRKREVYIAPASRWADLQSIGYVVSKNEAELLLIDDVSLDSVRKAFDYLHAQRSAIERFVLVGDGVARNGLDAQLFAYLAED